MPTFHRISRDPHRHDRGYVAAAFCSAVGRTKITAASGRITSDGGVMLRAAAERRLRLADRLAAADP